MAIHLRRRLRNLVAAKATRILIALSLASLASFFWTISLGGLVAFVDSEWLSGSGISFTVAAALAMLLTCAALAVAPHRRGKRRQAAEATPLHLTPLTSANTPQRPLSAQALATLLGRRRSRQESQLEL